MLTVTGRHWLLYRVGNEGLGGKAAKGEILDAVDVNANASHVPLMLTRFSSTSDSFFLLGSSGTEVVYDQSTTATPNPNTLTLVDLATDHRQSLPAIALHGTTVRFTIDGHVHVVTLQQVPTK